MGSVQTVIVGPYPGKRKTLAIMCNDRGHAKYMQVKFNEAIEDYTEALKLDPNLAVAYYNRGTIHYRLGNYHAAITDLTRAVTLDPKNKEFSDALIDCSKGNTSKNRTSL